MALKLSGLFVLILNCLIFSCNSHSHDHSHDDHDHNHFHEPASYKYSREANMKAYASVSEPSPQQKTQEAVANNDIWLYAMGSTLLISAAPVILLFIVPLDNTEQKQPFLKVILAFASGGLLGDAFLHLIPHANMKDFDDHQHHHHHHHHETLHEEGDVHDMSVGLGVLSGILSFLIIEKSVRILKGSHSHSHGSSNKPQEVKKNKIEKKNDGDFSKKPNKKAAVVNKKASTEEKQDIKVAGYLNLAADFSHNFTDGLAIGASYLAGNGVGVITTITILLHEVPHELGDFAILLQSGVSRRNAMLLQLTTAIGALAGTALSLSAQDGFGLLATNWILPFTAGGFIYIALVSVIPELLEEEKPSITWTILQLAAMLVGVYMMVLIAKYE